jgi:crotonobetainyl-CoA:carnitine CoA-transferase CaiB-like acyl-CoA transferase
VKLSDTPGDVHRIPPEIGEHSDEILSGLGYSDHEIADLRAQGVV